MVLYIALKQDAVPLDNEHSPPEHKQRFYCAPRLGTSKSMLCKSSPGGMQTRIRAVQPIYLWAHWYINTDA